MVPLVESANLGEMLASALGKVVFGVELFVERGERENTFLLHECAGIRGAVLTCLTYTKKCWRVDGNAGKGYGRTARARGGKNAGGAPIANKQEMS